MTTRGRSAVGGVLVVLIVLVGCAIAFVLISQGDEVDQLKTETERLSTAYEAIRSDTSANSEEIAAGDQTPPEAGAAGAPGASGSGGRDGRDGRIGQTGQTGAAGAESPAGADGQTGATGAAGVGVPGSPGAPGAPGADGADGADGAPGPTCPTGFSLQSRLEVPSAETWMVCVMDP